MNNANISIRPIQSDDLQTILQIQDEHAHPEERLKYFERCLEENKSGKIPKAWHRQSLYLGM